MTEPWGGPGRDPAWPQRADFIQAAAAAIGRVSSICWVTLR